MTATLLWIDHKQARLISGEGAMLGTVLATPPDEEEHRPNKPTASGRRAEQTHDRFFGAVLEALRGAGPLLLCGPSSAKIEFSKYLKRKAPRIEQEIIGIQTMDHPTKRQLAAFARNCFAPPPKK
ncbi:MAG: hypothetical protein HY901_14460 [Deltaproteobacteria bacterium]|nr:hypothetical protein [Deltaproteobacteria bacterium]